MCSSDLEQYFNTDNLVQVPFLLQELCEKLRGTPWSKRMTTTWSNANLKHIENGNCFVAQGKDLNENGFEYSKPQVNLITVNYWTFSNSMLNFK